jgi:hypothetical protein
VPESATKPTLTTALARRRLASDNIGDGLGWKDQFDHAHGTVHRQAVDREHQPPAGTDPLHTVKSFNEKLR